MAEIDLSELTFQIQEGNASDPLVREALVRRFAPEIHRLAIDMCHGKENRAEEALGLTAACLRKALADPDGLHTFGAIRAWLFAALLGLRNPADFTDPISGQRLRKNTWLPFLLRYGHGLPLEEIAEIIGRDPREVHRRLKAARRSLTDAAPAGSPHVGDLVDETLDGLLQTPVFETDPHFIQCEHCQDYARSRRAFEKQIRVDFSVRELPTLEEQEIQAILESLSPDRAAAAPAKARLPVRETLWAAGAVVGFLLLFILLNPIASFHRDPPAPTATLGAAEAPRTVENEANYEQLVDVMRAFPPPAWSVDTEFFGDHPATTGISFSPNGAHAAFGSYNSVILWDLESGTERTIDYHESVITSIAFGGGRFLASGSESGIVRIWDIIDGRNRYVLDDLPRPVSTLVYSEDGFLLAAGGNSGFRVWEFRGGALLEVHSVDYDYIRSLAFSPQNNQLAAVDRTGALSVWRLSDFTRIARFDTLQRFNTALAYSPNGTLIASASMDGSAHVFDLVVDDSNDSFDGVLLARFDHPTWVSDLAWVDNHYLLTVSRSRESSIESLGQRGIYTWEVSTGLPAAQPLFIEGESGVLNLRITEEDALMVGSFNRKVYRLQHLAPMFTSRLFGTTPSDILLPGPETAPAPDELSFDLRQQDAAEFIGYAQVLNTVFTAAIPEEFTPAGASYRSRVATFRFTRDFALGLTATVYIRVRPFNENDPLPLKEDWIGSTAPVETVQFGAFVGERVHGAWAPSSVDPPGEEVFRWADSPLTRFRWIQQGFLVEVISDSEIARGDTRWRSLFQPLILAMMSPANETRLMDYTVIAGDTCILIADRFGTTPGRIAELNALDTDCTILAGEVLTVPLPPAFGLVLEEDLDCDGVIERLRAIPNPLQPNTDVYFGFVLEDIPDGNPEFDYADFWTYALPEIDVDFFTPPEFIVVPDSPSCPVHFAITGYGGSGLDSGLRIFKWQDGEIQLALASDGFAIEVLDRLVLEGPLITRALEYDTATNACTEILETYVYDDGRFQLTGTASTPGLTCFATPH